MYNKEMAFNVVYQDIELEVVCNVSSTHYGYGSTSVEDVIEEIIAINHNDGDIYDLLSNDAIDEIQALAYEEYYR